MNICECNKILRGTATLSGGNLVITLPNVSLLSNGDIVRFIICSTIDYSNPLGTVTVIINNTKFALKTKFGNDVRIQQLRSRKVYTVGVGAQDPDFTMISCIPESSFSFPTYPSTLTATSTTTNKES